MPRFKGYEACPKCQSKGKDRRGDNLGRYADGGGHCFSCGYHEHPPTRLKFLIKEPENDTEKAVLPSDFTREVPAYGWKWLLQYGLSYFYWKPFTGYSPKDERLILTVGNPIRFSTGRLLSGEKGRKWFHYGNVHGHVETLGGSEDSPIVLVEDLISAHKVAQVAKAIPLFGTHIHDHIVKTLQGANRPVVLWLDADQYNELPKKIARLQTFLRHPVTYVHTEKDPKSYSIKEIEKYLK